MGKAATSNFIQYVPWAGNAYDTENKRQLKDFMTSMERSTLMGIFGRVNYNYLQKYLFSFTFRRDGSSKFGKMYVGEVPVGRFRLDYIG
ncbi:MAG: hypothetical protein V8R91_08010 [Butyricimonas faecihominis]